MSGRTTSQVAEMYDSPGGQSGHIIFDGQYHWGYWDETNLNASVAQAADRLTQIMIAKSTIQKGQRFCDLGCGLGVPAIKIAKAKGCFVDGITISRYQYEQAQKRAKEAGMANQVRFNLGNALDMPCEDETYDGGWFFETIFHMGHREALQEAYRILKPGAVLLITDLPILPTTTEQFKVYAEKYIQSVFVGKEEYPDLLSAAGFNLLEIDDITQFVTPYLAQRAKVDYEKRKSEILQFVSADVIDFWVHMFEYMCANLGYMIVTAQKRT